MHSTCNVEGGDNSHPCLIISTHNHVKHVHNTTNYTTYTNMSMINKLIKERERERDTHIGKPASYRASRCRGRCGVVPRHRSAREGGQGTGKGHRVSLRQRSDVDRENGLLARLNALVWICWWWLGPCRCCGNQIRSFSKKNADLLELVGEPLPQLADLVPGCRPQADLRNFSKNRN